jgi:hypothetical protein
VRLSRLSDALPGLLLATFAINCQAAVPLEWKRGDGFREAEVRAAAGVGPGARKVGFTLTQSAETGIQFTNFLAEDRHIQNQILLNGSGVAAGDVDGDGWCDLYFCGLDGPNVLYKNLGDWKFQEVTATAGVACAGLDATGATFADLDGDGDLDLIVNSVGAGTHVFANDGTGRFESWTVLNQKKGGTTTALADIDGDGDLDLYIGNYRVHSIRDMPDTKFRISEDRQPVVLAVNGRTLTPEEKYWITLAPNGQIIENGEPDVLYRNDGKQGFTALSFTNGAFLKEDGTPLDVPPHDWALAVMFRDFSGDGAPDIYVCNDFKSEDRIWINDGHGKFRAIARLALRNTSLFSMGVDFADLNGDGLDDIFVADMLSRDHVRRHVQQGDLTPERLRPGETDNRPQYSRNTLFLSHGDGTYAQVAEYSGVHASEWSWTPIFLDVDLDGLEDLIISTGLERDAMHADIIDLGEKKKNERTLSSAEKLGLNKMFPRLVSPKMAFRNRGDLTFEEVGSRWGFDTPGVSQGMALADLDNDGDMDVVVNNLNSSAGVYRNEATAPRIAVRLKGAPPNTRGIGAKIKVTGGVVPVQRQEMICGGRYVSSDDTMRVFAVDNTNATIEVTWRSGKKSVVSGAKPNRIYEIEEASAHPAEIVTTSASSARSIFRDVSNLINHRHQEQPFDDFDRQPLLPRRLSQLGPGVAWYDIDGDGWDDLVVGAGRGGKMAVFRNLGDSARSTRPSEGVESTVTFEQSTNNALSRSVGRDQSGIVGMGTALLTASSNYEDGTTNGGWVRLYDFKRQVAGDSILGPSASAGPVAIVDIDGDEDLDVFVGGRVVPGRYPESADSILVRNEGGRLAIAQRLEKLGLVSGAVWSDLDGDGRAELVLACDWGPLRVFAMDAGKVVERTDALGLAEYRGWWNGVATGDFDNDGRLDIVASNWGLNNRYHTFGDANVQVYFWDIAGIGTIDVIESYIEPAMKRPVAMRNLRVISKAMPFVRERFQTYQAFAEAAVKDIFGAAPSQSLTVKTLASTLFLNRGDRFEAKPLPMEAQLAPAFGVCVADFDSDGNEDVFLSQNFFAVPPDIPRCDAGRGLWLKGDGKGNLQPVPGQESGITVYGEQRGCAVGDYDADGRVDLVVSQNGAATRLFHNTHPRAGLRVRLKGPAANPAAIGASIRLVQGDQFGPLREIQGGSGYWSQNSSVQVMGGAEKADKIWVRWPGGRVTTTPIPKGAKDIVVEMEGTIRQAAK